MVLSLHPLLKSLTLPLVTAILTAGLAEPSLGSDIWQWSGWEWPGWSALEAIGTVSAVLAAILLAWREGSKERRRLSSQRKTIRLLLYQEVAANQEEIRPERLFIEEWCNKLDEAAQDADPTTKALRSRSYDWPQFPDARMPVVIMAQLHAQLDLYSLSFDADEVEQIDSYYDRLRDYWELRSPARFDALAPISEFMEWIAELRSAFLRLETIGDELLNLIHKE
jgi:hypothetical protein